jgi:hypothetical protein
MLRASFLGQVVLTERAPVSFFPSLPASQHVWLSFSLLDQPSLVFARHAMRENSLFMHLGRLFFSTSSISLRNSWVKRWPGR